MHRRAGGLLAVACRDRLLVGLRPPLDVVTLVSWGTSCARGHQVRGLPGVDGEC